MQGAAELVGVPAIVLLQLRPGDEQRGMRAAQRPSGEYPSRLLHIPLSRLHQRPLRQQRTVPAVAHCVISTSEAVQHCITEVSV